MIGVDCGTYNLIVCQRDENKNFNYKREVNAFIEIPTEDPMVFNMMKQLKDEEGKPIVPLMEFPNQKIAYALGEAAVRMAYTIPGVQLKRPMKDGCLNPSERNAQFVMATMIHGMLDEVKHDKESLYYSVPANAINEKTDADYHSKVLESVFKSFQSEKGHIVVPRAINEGLALIYAELGSKMWTGIGISFGAGMVNLCFAIYGNPVFQFAIVNSGDWIDQMAAKAAGESVSYINKEKEKVDLDKPTNSLVDSAIRIQYEIMIQKTVAEIKKGFEVSGNKARTDLPVDVVVAGGTTSPNGFEKLFAEALAKAGLPVKLGNVIKPKEPLKSVARGCLLAAEANP
jgi:actin-like ATPase involved in cell morphogenesis